MKKSTKKYFNQGRTIYFGTPTNATFVKSMQMHLISQVEAEVSRLNGRGR